MRRRTIGKRLRKKLQEVKQQLSRRMHDSLESVGKWLGSVVRGYFNYHAVPGNLRDWRAFGGKSCGCGGERSAAAASATVGVGIASRLSSRLACPDDASCIPILRCGLPLNIPGRSRMR